MMNRYPAWKYMLISIVVAVAAVFALPNLFGEDPALQISAARGTQLDAGLVDRVEEALTAAGLDFRSADLRDDRLLVRLRDGQSQLAAAELLREDLGGAYVVALNLAPATPGWLRGLGALPMTLGLDLRGGVHFLMEVDLEAVRAQAAERYVEEVRAQLRSERIRYVTVGAEADGRVVVRLRDEADVQAAAALIEGSYPELLQEELSGSRLRLGISDEELLELQRAALDQNVKTLRNRVNELGVAEPLIQKQGDSRIVVQLPGVQDTARAKDILGATATLEFRLVDEEHNAFDAAATGRVPAGARLYRESNGNPILLQRRVMLTGDYITDASSGIDQQSGGPAVFITLDGTGARRFSEATKDNVGKLMAVVFIENRTETRRVDGELQRETTRIEEVINVARIRDRLSKRFQITGLDGTSEARDLALLLRAGALAAPVQIIEERTVGPSMGQDNIDQGFRSVLVGFLVVLVFMALYYRVFGVIADVALALNLVLMIAVLSAFQATLTLPGIAGIVLTVGMAVDANVLIFERIREELRLGNSPQASIHAGYEKALSTIADANITTLIAAVVLFAVGTGPVKGFAVTLAIGIVTSMFTAIMVSRGLVNLVYGGRRVRSLAI